MSALAISSPTAVLDCAGKREHSPIHIRFLTASPTQEATKSKNLRGDENEDYKVVVDLHVLRSYCVVGLGSSRE
jgi:hypothetical protein